MRSMCAQRAEQGFFVRIAVIFAAVFILFALTASCGQKKKTHESSDAESAAENAAQTQDGIISAVSAYFPFKPDTLYVYEGAGHSLAQYSVFNTFISSDGKKIQRLLVLGEQKYTQTEVLALSDEGLVLTYGDTFRYHFENMTDAAGGPVSLILKEPLDIGQGWDVSPGVKARVTGADVPVKTPMGEFLTLEITSEYGSGYVAKDYYAKGIGVVKATYAKEDGQNATESVLAAIEENTAADCPYYHFFRDPSSDSVVFSGQTRKLKTNYNYIETVNAILTSPSADGAYEPLINAPALLNVEFSYVNNALKAVFSEALYEQGYKSKEQEDAVLRAAAATVGKLSGIDSVFIRVNDKPYAGVFVKNGDNDYYSANISNSGLQD